MNNTNNRIIKTFAGITLSLTIAFSAVLLPSAQPVSAATASKSSVADNVISTGKKYLGVRYQFGAPAGRTDVFDCSSFTQYVFKKNGVKLPRTYRQQAKVGSYVPKSQIRAGDLVFSDTNRDGIINHVGIYMGNGKVIHTYKVGVGVTISNFKGSSWERNFVTARRVI